MEPIEDVLCLRLHFLLNGAQARVAVGQHCELARHRCTQTRQELSVPAGSPSMFPFERTRSASPSPRLIFCLRRPRSSVPVPVFGHVATIWTTATSLSGSPSRRSIAGTAMADFSSRRLTRFVRFRTVTAFVLADAGSNSPNKSATFPNGIRAASFAVG